jgi:hypothetical protein
MKLFIFNSKGFLYPLFAANKVLKEMARKALA